MTIDISDLDIKVLLRELWNNTITAGFFRYNGAPPPPYVEPERYDTGFDYHCGRPIKTDFSDLKNVETRDYNRDAGDNAFEKIVATLRYY